MPLEMLFWGAWHFLGVVSPLRLIYMLMRMYKGNDFYLSNFYEGTVALMSF